MSRQGRWWYLDTKEKHHEIPIMTLTTPDGKQSRIHIIGEVSANYLAHDLNDQADRIKNLEQRLAQVQQVAARWEAFQKFFKMDHVRYHVLHEHDVTEMDELRLNDPRRDVTGLDLLMDWCIKHGKTPTEAFFDKNEAEDDE